MKPRATRICFVGHRAFDGFSAARVLPVTAIISCDSADVQASNVSIRTLSLEQQGADRRHWTSSDIDDLVSHCKQWLASSGPVDLLPYMSTSAAAELEKQGVVRSVLAAQSQVTETLNDKREGVSVFAECDMPNLPTEIATTQSGLEVFGTACQRVGFPCVVRATSGSTGTSTYEVADRRTLRLWFGQHGAEANIWLVQKKQSGISLNINAVASPDGIYLYPPTVQLIGLQACTSLQFGYCGNDHNIDQWIDEDMIERVYAYTYQIGSRMLRRGYLGCFGVDYICDRENDQLYPCEINARFQNSTFVLNYGFLRRPDQSPVSVHCEAVRHETSEVIDLKSTPPEIRLKPDRNLSQVIAYSPLEAKIAFVRGKLEGGRYRFDTGERCVERSSLLRGLTKYEYLLTSSIPNVGMPVEPNATLFKLITTRRSTDPAHGGLDSEVASALQSARAQLNMAE